MIPFFTAAITAADPVHRLPKKFTLQDIKAFTFSAALILAELR